MLNTKHDILYEYTQSQQSQRDLIRIVAKLLWRKVLYSNSSKHIYFIEKERLRKQNTAVEAICGGNFSAPVHNHLIKGTNVLDSGCGPGSLTLSMHEKYPHSTFYGIDRAPVFPIGEDANNLVNCKFACHNILEPMTFPDNHFGFIHQQFLVGGIPERGWPNLLKEFMRVVKPGGWVELTEVVPTDIFNSEPKYEAVNNAMIQCAQERGIIMSAIRELGKYLMDAGAVNIQNRPQLFPIGHAGSSNHPWIRENIISVLRHQFQPVVSKMHPELQDPESYENICPRLWRSAIDLKHLCYFIVCTSRNPCNNKAQ